MWAALFRLFQSPKLAMRELSVLSPSPLSEQLTQIVREKGNPQKDFERRVIGSVVDNSAVAMSDFARRLSEEGCEIQPISRMEVKIELSFVDAQVKWNITNIWSKTPSNADYLVNESMIQEKLSERQRAQDLSAISIFSHQKGGEPSHVSEMGAEALLARAKQEETFLELPCPDENSSRDGQLYRDWLARIFQGDDSQAAGAILAELVTMAAQSPYNHFIFHLLTAADPMKKNIEYRPSGFIPQTNINHDPQTHVTTMTLSACVMAEQVFDSENPMGVNYRYCSFKGDLISVDGESTEQLKQFIGAKDKATEVWMRMMQPSEPKAFTGP
jgi:hypothetical protein